MLKLTPARRFAPSLVALALTALAGPAAVVGQADIPRTSSGVPDMNGIWQALGNAHWDIEAHTARPALQMQEGPVVPVPAREVLAMGAVGSVPSHWGIVEGGSIPYLPEALERKLENQADWVNRDPEIKCYLPGVPRAMYMPFPFQVFQSESAFFMAFEYAGAVRNVYLEDPGPPQVDSWMGQSVGHWEGDTFVVVSNAVFGWIKAGQKSGFDERYFSVDFSRTDHAAVAAAYGVKSWSVSDPAALKGVLEEALNFQGPTLVDIVAQPLHEARAPVSEWVA